MFPSFRIDYSGALPPYSDKAILPPSVLSRIVDEIPESELPHPLIFKIFTSKGTSFIGVKEFSSPEETTIVLPAILQKDLGEEDATIELVKDMPKATSLTLKPTQLYNIQNWKFFLENKLTKFYTTLTSQSTLIIEDESLRYELIVDSINENATTACIIDTDIVLDVVPLNDQLANEQMLEFASNPHNNISEIEKSVSIEELRAFSDPKFVPTIYKIDLTLFNGSDITITLTSSDFNCDIIVGLDRFINLENFRNSTMDSKEEVKSVVLHLSDDDIANKLYRVREQQQLGDSYDEIDKWAYVVVFAWQGGSKAVVELSAKVPENIKEQVPDATPGFLACSNCGQSISPDKLPLHEAFCLRNNVRCSCGSVFLKTIPETHWHCDQCDFFCDVPLLKTKHIKLFHSNPYRCSACSDKNFDTFFELATHKSSLCPAKLHECRFCHLVVPQEEYTYQDRFENLTHHENYCGNRTTECYKCGKIQRIKDIKKHMKLHELDKVSFNQETKLSFHKCSNVNCVSVLNGKVNELELCDLCFGPLYVAQVDPNNMKLQARLERKYMMQLTRGCGNSWCTNQYCATSDPSLTNKTMREHLNTINEVLFTNIATPSLPINSKRSTSPKNTLWFCVNESVAQRKALLEQILNEGAYEPELIYTAINSSSNPREWLQENGVRQK